MADTIRSEEDRLVRQHQSTKAAVESDIASEVALRAEQEAHRDHKNLDDMAQRVKEKSEREVREAERIAEKRKKLARTVQVIDWAFGVLYVLLATRLVLNLIGANPEAGFVELIRAMTDPFFNMFRGIVRTVSVEGGFVLAFPILVAMGAYALAHWGLRSLAKLIAYRESEI